MTKLLPAFTILFLALLLGLSACIEKVEKKVLVFADTSLDTAPTDTLPGDVADTKDVPEVGPGDGGQDLDSSLPDAGPDTAQDSIVVADQHPVGADGGVFHFTVGPRISVPEGALGAEVTISAAESSTANAGQWLTPATPYVEFGPAGQTFTKDIIIYFPLDKALVQQNGADDFAVWTSSDGNAPWTALPHWLDESAALALVKVNHFSVFVAGYGHDEPCVPGTEVCDGQDNDCNQEVDEGVCVAGELCSKPTQCVSGTCAAVEGGDGMQCTEAAGACLLKVGQDPVLEIPAEGLLCVAEASFRICKDGALEDEALCKDGFPGNPICDAEAKACIPQCDDEGDCPDDGDLCNGTSLCSDGACVLNQSPVQCPASSDCGSFTCNPATGDCDPSPINEGGSCDDHDPCTTTSTCNGGVCVSGATKDCDDELPCTADSCNPLTGDCKNEALGFGVDCDDGDPCTLGEKCGDNGCVGFPKDCEDGNDCTLGLCDPQSGDCGQLPSVNSDCDDGSECTRNDVCDSEGVCKGEPFVNCADDNDCTVDSCDPEDGQCLHTPTPNLGAPCAYPNKTNPAPCVTEAVCGAEGVCQVKTLGCECQTTADCASKEDGNLCNGTLICDTSAFPYACKVDPLTVKTCGTTQDTDCLKNTCNPTDGQCSLKAVDDLTACDDKSACTLNESCLGGVCSGGTPLTCKDNKDCTTDGCNPETGCTFTHKAVGDPCEDGNACTVGDKCALGAVCNPGTTSNCDDGNACTQDACSFTDPFCTHTPIVGCCTEDEDCGGGGKVCYNNQCCTPNCAGRECGDNSCGGLCGTCSDGYTCDANFKCFCATCCQNSDECASQKLCYPSPILPACSNATAIKTVSFETGTSGVAYTGDGITYSNCAVPNPFLVDGSQSFAGTKSVKYSSSGKNCTINVPVNILVGAKNPSFSFWYNCKFASTMGFTIQVASGTTVLAELDRNMCPGTASWKRKTVSLGTLTGSQTVEFRLTNPSGKFLSMYLDQFEFLSEP